MLSCLGLLVLSTSCFISKPCLMRRFHLVCFTHWRSKKGLQSISAATCLLHVHQGFSSWLRVDSSYEFIRTDSPVPGHLSRVTCPGWGVDPLEPGHDVHPVAPCGTAAEVSAIEKRWEKASALTLSHQGWFVHREIYLWHCQVLFSARFLCSL